MDGRASRPAGTSRTPAGPWRVVGAGERRAGTGAAAPLTDRAIWILDVGEQVRPGRAPPHYTSKRFLENMLNISSVVGTWSFSPTCSRADLHRPAIRSGVRDSGTSPDTLDITDAQRLRHRHRPCVRRLRWKRTRNGPSNRYRVQAPQMPLRRSPISRGDTYGGEVLSSPRRRRDTKPTSDEP